MRKLLAFLKRDFLEESSYKLYFISSLTGIVVSSATFFFISKLIPGSGSSILAPYGGDYFSFVIIGIAFSNILVIFQHGLPEVIRSAQITGTLEALLVTKTSVLTILVGSSLYSLLMSFLRTVFHLLLALLVFGMKLGHVNWPGVISVFCLTTVCFVSVGILSASFILVYKKGNPFGFFFGSAAGFFGGVFFPIAVFPDWLRWISHLLPITYSLRGLRLSFLASVEFSEVLPSIAALAVFSLILFPLSLFVFQFSLKKAKRDGSLIQY
jgi:ABC-2 type transport system permease protein